MDIRNWPLGSIMQLPDCCFGRRFLVSVTPTTPSGGTGWDISEIALPERFVIWEFFSWWSSVELVFFSWRLALGDMLPSTTAEMDDLQPLFPGLGLQGAEPRTLIPPPSLFFMRWQLRVPVQAAGRRLIMELSAVATKTGIVTAGIIVSSLPTEVPDWLCSG